MMPRATWDALCARLGLDDDGLFEDLAARYDEPHRRYHTTVHLHAVVESIRDIAAAVDAPAHVADVALMAAWFHDAVYDPRAAAGANEAASAELARVELARRHVEPSVVNRVAALVEATATHTAPDGVDGQLLFDADLAILAADPADYDAYAQAVREEYRFVPDHDFRRGRAAVLRSLLEHPLFTTPPMRAREQTARANVARELARLQPPTPPAPGAE